MSEHQRKIELQSQSDLLYLQNTILAAAHEKIDLHLPPSAAQGTEDAFRNKVTTLVEQYVRDTMNLALPSLSVNGLDVTPDTLAPDAKSADQDTSHYEAYDTRLAQKVRDLYRTVADETTKVAGLRRVAPKSAADQFIATLTKDIDAADKEHETRRSELDNWRPNPLKEVAFRDQEDVRRTWSESSKGLDALRDVTKVKADLERAIRVAAEVEKP